MGVLKKAKKKKIRKEIIEKAVTTKEIFKDMLELLKFEEAGFKIKWIGYNRKQALKLKERRNA